MKTVEINNYPFSYIEDGSGDSVVFIHGSISDYRTWNNQMEPFAKHFHVIAYSRRYHYPYHSAETDSAYTVQQHSDDLADFLKTLDLGSVHIVASSYGAYAGLLTAIKHPALVKTLVLGEPPVIPLIVSNVDDPLQVLSLIFRDFSTGMSFLKFGVRSMGPAKKQLSKGKLKEGARLFTDGVLGKGGFERLPNDAKEGIMDNLFALQAELNGPGFPEAFPKEEAKKLKVPTLLTCSDESPKFFHTISDKLLKLLPNAQKVFIPDASHDMHGDNPKAYNEQVLAFLIKHN